MGTHLKMVTTQLGGHEEAALAAYNAGLSRAKLWLTWGDFKEPAEFIETIPFAETRSYVQIVLRNADLYRRTYGTAALAFAADRAAHRAAFTKIVNASYSWASLVSVLAWAQRTPTGDQWEPGEIKWEHMSSSTPTLEQAVRDRFRAQRTENITESVIREMTRLADAPGSESGAGVSGFSSIGNLEECSPRGYLVRYQSVRDHMGGQALPGRNRGQIQNLLCPGC